MLSRLPVSNHQLSGFTLYFSAHFLSSVTESCTGSTDIDTNCTIESLLLIKEFCNRFIAFASWGQMDGHLVKKKSRTMILPFRSLKETFFPNWLVNCILAT